ncbi:CPBP family intramembrane metalloprotease [Rothia sp. AR01]|uniref:CPBP family intramembrane metalloprotease n=1 Tax=Rothia santali TaxID=2949643 RepID=A0A9X2KHQ6_9MICC|nr:CPBP family intramembrane glutamic endopeptidase [Rothia santali]MCP3425170.1 CPBP family intramembrane metalloprotease [Rothia santali]
MTKQKTIRDRLREIVLELRKWPMCLVIAWGGVTLLYLQFGLAASGAVYSFFHPKLDESPWATSTEAFVQDWAVIVVVTAILAGVFKILGISFRSAGIVHPVNRRTMGWVLLGGLMAFGASQIKNGLTVAIDRISPETAYKYQPQFEGDAAGGLFLNVLSAGVQEELPLVPGIIMLMLFARVKPWMAIVLAMLARLSFHLYYGPNAIPGFLIWAFLIILIWRIAPTVWGLVLGHTFNNAVSAFNLTNPEAFELVEPVAIILAVIAAVVMLWVGFQGWQLLRRRGVFKSETFPTRQELFSSAAEVSDPLPETDHGDRWWPDAPESVHAELTGRRQRA